MFALMLIPDVTGEVCSQETAPVVERETSKEAVASVRVSEFCPFATRFTDRPLAKAVTGKFAKIRVKAI